ncbi:MAG: histidine kinase [Saprospiraceae bacterium]
METKELIYWVIIAAFVMPLLLSGILIWFFITFQKRKFQNELDKKDSLLREQSLIIEKQEAVEKERTRIASEMHDDLGSGLTTIRYLSDRALKNAVNEDEREHIQKIALQSNSLVSNMSEIIWAMNSRYDTLENLLSYLRHYASEYLEEYSIHLEWKQEIQHPELNLNGEIRRNVFLVMKEALHNIVKYAQSPKVKVEIIELEDSVQLVIRDFGLGFNIAIKEKMGNGLFNMEKRMKQIGASFEIKSDNCGTQIAIGLNTNEIKLSPKVENI